MSCLSITELSMAEQAALELQYAERLVAKIDAMLREHDERKAARAKEVQPCSET